MSEDATERRRIFGSYAHGLHSARRRARVLADLASRDDGAELARVRHEVVVALSDDTGFVHDLLPLLSISTLFAESVLDRATLLAIRDCLAEVLQEWRWP